MPSIDTITTPAATKVAPVISAEVKVAAAQVILSEDIEVSAVLRDKREETLALVQKLLTSAGIQITFSSPKTDEPKKMDIEISTVSKTEPDTKAARKIELTPAQKEHLLTNLRTNFEANMNLHPGIKWQGVQKKLENSSTTLITLNKMWARGGEPNVTIFDEKTDKYRFDDCSMESPKEGRDKTYPQAEQMAQAMGADLMEPEHYKDTFQNLGNFDHQSWNWLKTSKNKLQADVALYGGRSDGRYNGEVFVFGANPNLHYVHGGFRTSLWV